MSLIKVIKANFGINHDVQPSLYAKAKLNHSHDSTVNMASSNNLPTEMPFYHPYIVVIL